MGSNIGKDQALCSFVTQVVKDVARVPVWAKLTPATGDIVVEAGAVFRGGGDAVSSSNTFPSMPLIDPETLEFEMNVDGRVSSGGLGGPAILPQALAMMSQMTRAFPDAVVLRHRRHLGLRPRAELLPARLRHGAGLHRRDARSRRRPQRHRAAARGLARVPRASTPIAAGTAFDDIRGLARDRVVSHVADPSARVGRLSRRLRAGRVCGAVSRPTSLQSADWSAISAWPQPKRAARAFARSGAEALLAQRLSTATASQHDPCAYDHAHPQRHHRHGLGPATRPTSTSTRASSRSSAAA